MKEKVIEIKVTEIETIMIEVKVAARAQAEKSAADLEDHMQVRAPRNSSEVEIEDAAEKDEEHMMVNP